MLIDNRLVALFGTPTPLDDTTPRGRAIFDVSLYNGGCAIPVLRGSCVRLPRMASYTCQNGALVDKSTVEDLSIQL